MRQPFPCSQCGLCCQKVDMAEATRFLDRGDGTCRHYDTTSKGCTIYAQRPDICRVELHYDTHYAKVYSWSEFIELNSQVCQTLTDMEIKQAADPHHRQPS